MKQALVDTGFLVAVYDKRDATHSRCLKLHEQLSVQLCTCEAVISEASFLLQGIPGAAEAILANVDQGILSIPFNLTTCAAAISSILTKYSDSQIDFADACLIHMADELDTGDILTLDGDFRHYRWRRNRSFRLLIPLE